MFLYKFLFYTHHIRRENVANCPHFKTFLLQFQEPGIFMLYLICRYKTILRSSDFMVVISYTANYFQLNYTEVSYVNDPDCHAKTQLLQF